MVAYGQIVMSSDIDRRDFLWIAVPDLDKFMEAKEKIENTKRPLLPKRVSIVLVPRTNGAIKLPQI
jgi:hypothetical protein